MYQALYRKYRPSDFSEVIGQDVIVQTLKHAVVNNKISHAYLFTGPRGTGKTSIAKIFAKTINCENSKDGLPCNVCVSCTLINNKQSTDIIEIDAASNNGVDEIRNLKSKINLVPSNSKYKVYIIDEVHMLSTEAFNALLKTLEEPPSHVIFILATTEPQKLPSTILSRCQRYDFKRISNDKIVERLKQICVNENIEIEEDALYEIARISDGGMRDSISMLDQVVSYKNSKIEVEDIHIINGTLTQKNLSEFMNNIFNKDIEAALNLLDKYNNDGKNIFKLVDEIIFFMRNYLIYKISPKYMENKNIDISSYENINSNIDLDEIYILINNLNELKTSLKDSSNIKTLFEIEILKFLGMENSKNISQEINKEETIKIKPVENYNKPVKNQDQTPKNNDIPVENLNNVIISNNIKNIRINNTLAEFNKKMMLALKSKEEAIRFYILDDLYGKYAALLLDGTIKAASDKYMIYVYENEEDVNLFNSNLKILEELIEKSFKLKYHLISVTSDEWEKIKDEFNNKKKVYNYIEEPKIEIKEEPKKDKNKTNDIDELFNDIVEYTEEEIK